MYDYTTLLIVQIIHEKRGDEGLQNTNNKDLVNTNASTNPLQQKKNLTLNQITMEKQERNYGDDEWLLHIIAENTNSEISTTTELKILTLQIKRVIKEKRAAHRIYINMG